MRAAISTALALLLSLSAASARSEVVLDCSGETCRAQIAGVITESTAVALERQSAAGKRVNMVEFIDSPGGDVGAAMRVGRVLRKGNATAFVTGQCASSCVVALAGATIRYFFGSAPVSGDRKWNETIGLHRPFFLGPPKDATDTRRDMRALDSRLTVYFDEMNVPRQLLEAMNRTSSSEMRWITPAELAALGIGDKDPVFDEQQAAEQASQLGISRVEYHRRLNAAKACSRYEAPSAAFCSCLRSVGLPRC